MHHGRTHSDTAGRGAGGHAGRLGLRSSGKAYLARQGRKFYDTLCGGSLPAFAAALCASGLTAEELEELRELLREGTL